MGHLVLTVANDEGGRIEQARSAYAEEQRLSPETGDTLQMADELLPHHSPSESAYTGTTSGFVAGR